MQNTPLPFSFRYDHQKTTPTMSMEPMGGGFLSKPLGGQQFQWEEDMDVKVAVAYNVDHSDMPTGGKRLVSQSDVMGKVSPNEAAKALNLPSPTYPNWEWLHMIAFSIKPTHVWELSEDSSQLIDRTGQPQQISENLVLGTAASNTEMLSWETAIKKAAKTYNCLVQLVAMPNVRYHKVGGVTIPVCHRMKYDFIFKTQDGSKASVPFVVEFDTLSHQKPSSKSFKEVLGAVETALTNMVSLSNPFIGIRTGNMHGF